MDKIISVAEAKKKPAVRLNRNSKLFKTILEAIRDKKGEAIISLDLRKIDEAVADFFIICEAQSSTQIQAIGDSIQKKVEEECGERPYRSDKSPLWALTDYVNIVIHVFNREHRKLYDLESLWADADQQEHGSI